MKPESFVIEMMISCSLVFIGITFLSNTMGLQERLNYGVICILAGYFSAVCIMLFSRGIEV